jgi:hypothetical protein
MGNFRLGCLAFLTKLKTVHRWSSYGPAAGLSQNLEESSVFVLPVWCRDKNVSYATSTLRPCQRYDCPAFSTLTIPTAHHLHGKRRSRPGLRERADNIISTTFQGSNVFCLNIGLKATELSKPMKTIRNSPQLTLLVGHDMALIPYLSSENIKFDGGRRLAAAAKRRRPSDHCLIVPLYPRLVSILSLLGSGDTGDWSMGRLARRISSIISRHP